jgi:hypothetical protein
MSGTDDCGCVDGYTQGLFSYSDCGGDALKCAMVLLFCIDFSLIIFEIDRSLVQLLGCCANNTGLCLFWVDPV